MKVTSGPISSVWPSDADRATYSAAIWLLAPALFSTIACWPQASVKRCASMRPSVSVTPPGGAGTTMLTVLLGNVCAAAGPVEPNASKTPRTKCQRAMAKLPLRRDAAWSGVFQRSMGKEKEAQRIWRDFNRASPRKQEPSQSSKKLDSRLGGNEWLEAYSTSSTSAGAPP